MWKSHYEKTGLWKSYDEYRRTIGVVDREDVTKGLTHLTPFGLASLAGCPVIFEDVHTPEKFYATNKYIDKDNWDAEKGRAVLKRKRGDA